MEKSPIKDASALIPSHDNTDAAVHVLPSFKALQDAAYELTRVEYNWRLDRKRIFMAPYHYRELTLRSVKEINIHLHTKPKPEAHEMALSYIRCITVLADQVYWGDKDLDPGDEKLAQRIELIGGLQRDLLDLIKDVELYWCERDTSAQKVPDALFEPERESLGEQVSQLQKSLKGRHLDEELVEYILKPLQQMACQFRDTQLTWQRLNYNKRLLSKLAARYKKDKKFTNESLLDLLMQLDFNQPELIKMYVQLAEAQMAKKRTGKERVLFLRKAQKEASLWSIPEYKGLLPDTTSAKEAVIESLEYLIAIQKIHEEEEAIQESQHYKLKTEPIVSIWMIRIFREFIIDASVSLEDAFTAFKRIFSIGSAKHSYNQSFQMTEDEYDLVSGLLKKMQRFVDQEWKRIQQKKEEE